MNFWSPLVTLINIAIDNGQLEEEEQQRARIEVEKKYNVIEQLEEEEYNIALIYGRKANNPRKKHSHAEN